MAHIVTIRKILPGQHRAQFHIFIESDGASGDLVNEVLISPSDLSLPPSARLSIEFITYNLSGFDARLEFDSGNPTDNMIWVLPQSSDNHVDFSPWGRLKDPSGLDGTGKIQLTTSGLTEAGDQGSILIQVRDS